MTTVTDHYGREVALPGPYRTMAQIRKANGASGHHWFEPQSMGFFDSRIESDVIHGRLFVSSEQHHPFDGPSDPRLYTVRCAHDDGRVTQIGEFQQYRTRTDALVAAINLGRPEPARAE